MLNHLLYRIFNSVVIFKDVVSFPNIRCFIEENTVSENITEQILRGIYIRNYLTEENIFNIKLIKLSLKNIVIIEVCKKNLLKLKYLQNILNQERNKETFSLHEIKKIKFIPFFVFIRNQSFVQIVFGQAFFGNMILFLIKIYYYLNQFLKNKKYKIKFWKYFSEYIKKEIDQQTQQINKTKLKIENYNLDWKVLLIEKVIYEKIYHKKTTSQLTHTEISKKMNRYDQFHFDNFSGKYYFMAGEILNLKKEIVEKIKKFHIENNHIEVVVPHVLPLEAFIMAGQYPKFKNEMFQIYEDKKNIKFLISTSEIPLLFINQKRKIVQTERFFSHSLCFRNESISHGVRSKGMIRTKEFEKIELFSLCSVEDEKKEIDYMENFIDSLLESFNLIYRKKILSGNDLSVASRITIDYEVWLPGSEIWLEISSLSSCGCFQTERAMIKSNNNWGVSLNGSALPINRLITILFEYKYL